MIIIILTGRYKGNYFGRNYAKFNTNKVVGKFYLRAGTVFELEEVIRHFEQTAHRFSRQFKTPVQIRQYESRYLPLRTHKGLAQVFLEKTQYLGIKMDKKPYQIVGSMDMGNVSWQVPAIHPYLPLGAGDIPAHTLEFAKKAGGQEGEKTDETGHPGFSFNGRRYLRTHI